jgi:hypothetical protein
LLVPGLVCREGLGADPPADVIEGDRDVDVLVSVDTDDDSTPTRVGIHACHSGSSFDQGATGTRRWPAGRTGL